MALSYFQRGTPPPQVGSMTRERMMTIHEEFPDYPIDSLPPLPEGWQDMSWANDACPCFGFGDLIIFIDFPEAKDREFPETKRFSVMRSPELAERDGTRLDSDDWSEVLAFVKERAQ